MPFSRHPLDYPINRLLLKVGMALQSWIPLIPPIYGQERRREFERSLATFFELDAAIEAELLSRYRFCWYRRSGRLRTINLIPHPKVRRTPGIYRLRQILFNKK